MTTRRLYYDDAFEREFTARVVHCEPLPPDVNSGITAPVLGLVLDQTAFYPSSGGQPHDLEKSGMRMYSTSAMMATKSCTLLTAAPVARTSRAASTGHAGSITRSNIRTASAVGDVSRALWQANGVFHLGTDVSTIDLKGPEPSDEILEGAERAANSII
jgi:alanyl-tRNA synthetase